MVDAVRKRLPLLSKWIEETVRLPADVAVERRANQILPVQRGIAEAIAGPKIECVIALKSEGGGFKSF
jgi:hypothetical protein